MEICKKFENALSTYVQFEIGAYIFYLNNRNTQVRIEYKFKLYKYEKKRYKYIIAREMVILHNIFVPIFFYKNIYIYIYIYIYIREIVEASVG